MCCGGWRSLQPPSVQRFDTRVAARRTKPDHVAARVLRPGSSRRPRSIWASTSPRLRQAPLLESSAAATRVAIGHASATNASRLPSGSLQRSAPFDSSRPRLRQLMAPSLRRRHFHIGDVPAVARASTVPSDRRRSLEGRAARDEGVACDRGPLLVGAGSGGFRATGHVAGGRATGILSRRAFAYGVVFVTTYGSDCPCGKRESGPIPRALLAQIEPVSWRGSLTVL